MPYTQILSPDDIAQKIIEENRKLENFWSNSYGWSPPEAADLLNSSMLHWQTQLSECLTLWTSNSELTEGQLILAWTNLGALIEGSLKLFLCVYLIDYHNEDESLKLKKNKKIKLPDEATLEWLKAYYKKKDIFPEFFPLIEKVQHNRNSIHSFKARVLDSFEEYKNALLQYYELLQEIQFRLPYPDDHYRF